MKSKQKLSDICQDWNTTVPVGTPCKVNMDDGTARILVTRSEAWVMGGHSAMVMLEGISGAFKLDRCTAL
jgi:hypothetical protein